MDEQRPHNAANRPVHPLPDRDGRQGITGLATGSAGGIGPSAGHGGNDNYGVFSERDQEVSVKFVSPRGFSVLILL